MDSPAASKRIVNRRPLLLAALCFAPGVVLGRYIPASLIYGMAAAALTAAAFCVRYFKRTGNSKGIRIIWLAGAACAMLAAFLTSNVMAVKPVATGEELRVTGHVYSEPELNDYGSYVYLLDGVTVEGETAGNVKLYVPAELGAAVACGDVVEAVAKVEYPRGVRNPGGFDERLYLLSQGVQLKAYTDSVAVTGYRSSFAVAMVEARQYIGAVMDRVFEADVAPVAKGLLLGDKRGLDDETYAAFKDTGMAHVLAVSGLHAGILIAAAYLLFRLLRMGRTPRLAATLVFIAAYACLTGLAPSILRASVMAGTLLLHRHFGRQSDALNGLTLAFIAALLLSPLDLFMAGFQLSFGAVFGILTLGWQLQRWFSRRLPRWLSWPGGAVSASAGATAGTLPVLAASFNRITFFSVLLNIVMIPVASAAIVLVFICTLAGLVYAPAASILAYMPSVLIRFMTSAVQWAAELPFMAVNVASPPWYAVLACFALLFVTSKYLLVRVRLKTALSVGVSVLALAVLLLARLVGLYIVFLDVGQADAAFVRTAQGGEYFMDGGRPQSAEEVVDFTIRSGITPEAAFVSHTDDDHFAGIAALYQAGLLNKVYCSYQEEANVRQALPDAEVVPLCAGDAVLLDDDTRAVVLYPYQDTVSESANELSLVVCVEYKGHTALFAGDINGQTETAVLTAAWPVDIYKAAHHGSKFSSYRLPLSALAPRYSVVSVGANNYGHPHQWAMDNLEDYSGDVFVTRDDYAVEFFVDDNIKVNTFGDKQHAE